MKIGMLTLKSRVLLFFIFICLCFISIYIHSIFKYVNFQIDILEKNQEVFSNQIVKSTEKHYNDLANISARISNNQSVQQYLLENDGENKLNNYFNVNNLLISIKALNNTIVDLALLNTTGSSMITSDNISVYQDYYKNLPNEIETILFLNRAEIMKEGHQYTCQIAAMPIYQLSHITKKPIGILFLAIDPSTIFLDNIDSPLTLYNKILFANAKNQLIHGPEELFYQINTVDSEEGSTLITYNNTTYVCKKFHIDSADGTLYTLFNQTIYTNRIKDMILQQSLLMVTILLIAILILIAFLNPITNSLVQVTGVMKKISSGKQRAMHERIPITITNHTCKEVYSIAISLNEMLDEIERLHHTIFDTYTKMYQLELNNKKRELSYLKNQINPHFLYNTLTLISGLASMNESERIIDITLALSQISRYSIKSSDIVTLKQELDISKSYLMIQMTRFEDRFSIEFDITDDVYDALIPSMIIQPLIENAVKHGFEKGLTKGHLTIGGRKNKKDNTLVLWVYDTGVGMSKDKLNELRQMLKDSSNYKDDIIYEETNPEDHLIEKTCLGLRNINSRIHLYYGEPYKLNIDSDENVGTNIQIKIPFRAN